MTSNQKIEEWAKTTEQKYKSKTFTPSQTDKLRDDLVNKYGNKIIPGMSGKLTDEETFARAEYEILSKYLYEAAPDVKRADMLILSAIKAQIARDNLFKTIKKVAFVVLFVLLFLALIKYLTS